MREVLADPAKLLGVMVVVAVVLSVACYVWWRRFRLGPVVMTEAEWRAVFEPNLENVKIPPPPPEDWRDWKPV